MDSDREDRTGQVPLPGFGEPRGRLPAGAAPPGRRPARPADVELDPGRAHRRYRGGHRGAGAPCLPPVAATAGAATTAATGGQAAVNGTSGPQVSHSVATTSGSGATVTTTTQTVNGKTVIVRTVHPAAYHDN